MRGGMLDAVRGCLKEEIRMDVLSNNLANSTTIGFKRNRLSFQEALDEQMKTNNRVNTREDGRENPGLVYIGLDLNQGDIRTTGNPLDFAINGKGFFKIETPDGLRYTRKGNFRLDAEGYVVTQEGLKVMGKGGPINISGNEINMGGNGAIMADGSEVGQLEVIDFKNPQNLIKEGTCLFKKTGGEQEVPPSPGTRVVQGYIEGSNVDVAEEIVQMIYSLRSFESYQKSIQILDGINNRAINEVSRLR